jgi:CDP-glycerol glycerophosphotransferase
VLKYFMEVRVMNSIWKRMVNYYKDGSLGYHVKVSLWRNKKLYKIYGRFTYLKRINNRKIVFSNMNGVGYGGDPKYISDYILGNDLEYEIVWLIDKHLCKNLSAFPKQIKIVDIYSMKGLEELGTAHFWIDNCRKLIFPPKKKDQIYIQTWHGTFPTKYIEKDAESDLDKTYIKSAKKDSSMIDYIISGCRYKTEIYKNGFYYNGKVLEIGTPKEDIFFDASKVFEVRSIPVK